MKKLVIILAALLTFTTTAFAQIGSLSSDLVFTPVTPCRIFDTRTSQGGTGPIGTNGTKTFAIWGQTSYASQGGKASNCGITAGSNTAAVALSMVVVAPSTVGYLTAYPAGETQPLASTMNFNTGELVVSNAAILKVNQTNGNAALSIFASSSTEVIADVVGYYSKPVATALQCQDTTEVSVPINTLVNGRYGAFVQPGACPAGFTSVALRCGVSSFLASASEYDSISDGYCAGNSLENTANLTARRTCCRIPGR